MTLKEAIEEAIDCTEIVKSDRCCTEREEKYMDDVIAKLKSLAEIDETLLRRITIHYIPNMQMEVPESE